MAEKSSSIPRNKRWSAVSPSDIDDIIADAEGEAEEDDVKLPSAKNDPWERQAAFKRYERESRIPYFSERHKTKIGGNSLDISTFSSQERKKASFTKKDPFTPRHDQGYQGRDGSSTFIGVQMALGDVKVNENRGYASNFVKP